MAINKVIYGDNTLMDLTGDTVSSNTLLYGATAHNAAGEEITGSIIVPEPASNIPADLGTAAVGTSEKFAREDHVHEYPDYVHVGASAPSDSNIQFWYDTDASTITDWSAFFEAVYPVGSIYMSVNNTSPATLFGGTWQQIKDTFLLSAGDTYIAGNTGGESTHTLTADEMPRHSHTLLYYKSDGTDTFGYSYQNKGKESIANPTSSGIGWAGNSQAHNNMPPYLVVYVWQRTA